MTNEPTKAFARPCLTPGEHANGTCDFVKRSRFSALAPRLATDQTTMPRIADRDRGREPGEQLHAAVDDAPPAQPVVRPLQDAEIGSAHCGQPLAPRRRAAR